MRNVKTEILNTNTYPFIFTKRLYKILIKINDRISSNLIKAFENKEMFEETFVDITEREDTISFLSSNRVNKLIMNNKFNSKEILIDPQRIEIKIGRFIYRIFGDKFPQKEIEDFVNSYKALLKHKSLYRNFKIIEGDAIKKWYLSENYSPGEGGNLSKSCMRHRFAQTFFDIYTKNPDKVKLLILLDDTKKLILGRALLWYLDIPKGVVLMDRIYYSEDHILNMFVNYAIKNEWYYKIDNDNPMISYFNDKPFNMRMVVKLKKFKYELFPFVDNMGFYSPDRFLLTNDPKYLKKIGCEKYYDLCDHLGEYEVRKDFEY